ncbi:MAG: hypothetical protein N2312_02335, partial [Dictyoglomaceae bacterium]|nr:hypothetical protein [Dictyoglomaceae bacterium]
ILEKCSEGSMEKLKETLYEMAQSSYINSYEIRKVLIEGWEKAVEHFLGDGNLNVQEEIRLRFFINYFKFKQNELDSKGWNSKGFF